MSLSPESKQNRLDELYEYGKSKGTITYKEIMDRVMGMDLDADQLDHVLPKPGSVLSGTFWICGTAERIGG